jgi:quercetin dioxygenase-like cupin family protein
MTVNSPLTARLPPGRVGEPYIISTQDGEIIYIPLSKSATRLLVTGKESDDAFAIVSSGGSQSDPIGFHYHKEAHDVFLCLQGNVNVWADDDCRTLSAGDFASVPPVCANPWSHRILLCTDITRAPFTSTRCSATMLRWLVS